MKNFIELYESRHDRIVTVLLKAVDFWADSDDSAFEILCVEWKSNCSSKTEFCHFMLDYLV